MCPTLSTSPTGLELGRGVCGAPSSRALPAAAHRAAAAPFSAAEPVRAKHRRQRTWHASPAAPVSVLGTLASASLLLQQIGTLGQAPATVYLSVNWYLRIFYKVN